MALIKCPECGRTVSDKASNCPDCAYPVYLSVNEAFEKKKCQYCGLLNEHYANKCSGCGAILEHDAKSSIKENFSPVILPEVEENGMIRCDKCGFSMPTGITICKNCGNRLDNSEEVEQEEDNPETGKTKICFHCGCINKESAYRCKKCGYDFLMRGRYKSSTSNDMRYYFTEIFDIFRWILAALVAVVALAVWIAGDGGLRYLSIMLFLATAYFISPLGKKIILYYVYNGLIKAAIAFACFVVAMGLNPLETGDTKKTEAIATSEYENDETAKEKVSETEENVAKIETMEDTGLLKETSADNAESQEVFYADLLENWDSYVGQWIITAFPYGSYDEEEKTFDSDTPTDYDIYSRLTVNASNYMQLDSGEYVTVIGFVCEETDYDYILKESKITQYGDDAKSRYLNDKEIYDEKRRIEAEEYEVRFKEESVAPSYDDLSRYPDTYEETKIKVTVKITEVKPDGVILAGSYLAKMNGKEIVIYDDREVKEPKLLKGDTITIHGYGDGLTTIKLQEATGLIPKTVDKYTVPGINIKYVEFN